MKWRLVTHPFMLASAAEIDERWCLDDVFEAHDYLDALEDAHARGA